MKLKFDRDNKDIKKRPSFNITKKLFLITTIIFALFITSAFIVQSLFFEKYYVSKKKRELISHVENFTVAYNKADISTTDLLISEYEDEFRLKLLLYDNATKQYHSVKNLTFGRPDPENIPNLYMFARDWIIEQNDLDTISTLQKSVVTSKKSRDPNTQNIIAIFPNATKNQIIFAINSLQPVNEASETNKEFFLYFYAGSLFFIIILSLIYSNMIAKPLVKINQVATKMSKLDFSEKCVVTGNDEISNMASSLNFLSTTLHDALSSLKKANAKLEEDIEKERCLERMRKEFVTSVSHELKTPITLIDGYAEGLKDNIFEENDREYYLDIIIDESRKMGNLVSDMLDLSQLESGTFKLSKDTFALADLIMFTMKKYEVVIEEKSIAIEYGLIDDIQVFADWNRMEQVITNFITNALRHVDDNGKISIRMLNCATFLKVEIENTGSCISEDDLTKIWDKFYKIDKSRTRKLGGTGVGLSIVKNILLIHNFGFGAENTESGIKFFFTIPK
jgi:two-component system sensor histidine kinase VanS